MHRPDFFIAGAPKCGTTALYQYLREHPNIYLPQEKEPHYFADDLPGLRRVTTLDEYLVLYNEAADHHVVSGDASVTYLYSAVALKNIHTFNPDARIIIMLRNPVEMAYAYFAQLLSVHHENVTSFEKAWRLQAKRQQGDNIPQFCWEPKTLQYKQLCLLGEQYERLLTQFPRSQILTILIEDLKDSAKDVYERTLEFLDLPSDERVDFPIINPNDGHRLPWLAAQTWGSIPDKNKLSTVRRIVSMTRRVGLSDRPIWRIANKINRMNRRKEKRKPLAPAFHRELIDEFREDIMKLSRLVDRDLGHWLDSE